LVSKTGALEFAKQFWVKQVQVNLSPVSARAVLAANNLIGYHTLALKSNMSQSVLYRFAGAGYRTMSRSDSNKLSRRFKRIRAMASKPSAGQGDPMKQPIEWFYGRGLPLSLNSKGFILHQIREELKPQQLVLPPDDLMVEGERVNMEYTLYRNWMEGQYLKDLHWYHKDLFLEYDPSLETLFDPLVVCSSYKRKL